MKVLMLGWEFPPHISGGLGTACYGLTRGLEHHGVDVTFVMPRAHGDEDTRYVDLVGCADLRVPWVAHERTVGSSASSSGDPREFEAVCERADGTALGVDGRAADAIVRSLEILTVDSMLSPYLGEAEYARRYAARMEHESREGVRSTAATQLTTLWRALINIEGLQETGEQLDRIVRGESTLEFSGRYGPDLMTEVARYALAVAEIARTREFDVVHAHDWMTYAAGMIASAVSSKPLVVHMHASEFDRSGENVNPRIHELEKLGLFGSDLVVCVSHYTASIMRDRYGVDPRKLRVVHNAVTHREQQNAIHWRKAIDEPIVLFLGRVTFQKGPDYFLEAAARVVAIEPKVKFVMAGSGDMLPSMVERAARLGLARNLHFTGFLRGSDVERMYAMADIYVMPSVSEPFGISPLEAMALDVPVIVSRQSGVSEILRNALKVDFWDVDDLANKILGLLKYRALQEQLRDDGREEVRAIRWDYPAGLVRDVYEEVVA